MATAATTVVLLIAPLLLGFVTIVLIVEGTIVLPKATLLHDRTYIHPPRFFQAPETMTRPSFRPPAF